MWQHVHCLDDVQDTDIAYIFYLVILKDVINIVMINQSHNPINMVGILIPPVIPFPVLLLSLD